MRGSPRSSDPLARRNAAQRGYGHRWRKESKAYLAVHPWCVNLGEGCTRLATLVDHITPHRGDQALFDDMKNWQPLCSHCHNTYKQRIETAGPLRDHRGRLLDVATVGYPPNVATGEG